MSAFLQTLVVDAEEIGSLVIGALGKTKTAQLLEQYSLKVLLAVELKQTSIDIDGYTVSASWNNAPAAMSIGAAFEAIDQIALGNTGTFTVGSIQIVISKDAAPAPAAA